MAAPSRSRYFIVIGIILVIALAFFGARFMNVPQAESRAASAWGEVERQFQLRAYLTRDVIDVVRAVSPAQTELMAALEEKRQKVLRYPFDTRAPIEGERFRAFMATQDELSIELGKVMDLMQLYAERRSHPPISTVLAHLAQSESRIVVARSDYVRAAKSYNRMVTNFPTRWFANLIEPETIPMIVSFDMTTPAKT